MARQTKPRASERRPTETLRAQSRYPNNARMHTTPDVHEKPPLATQACTRHDLPGEAESSSTR